MFDGAFSDFLLKIVSLWLVAKEFTIHMSRFSFFRRFHDFGTGRLPSGSQLHNRRYLVMATIGQGGMGAIYLALDTQMSHEQVAIKEMSQADLSDPGALHRARQSFQQEAEMLRQLQHPNLPKVYTSFEEHGRSYLVMEYISGQTLTHTMKHHWNRPLPVSSVIEYGLQLASVLNYLHTRPQPIIYLDLKPPNIMLRKDDGRVFLIDFGIAHFFQPDLRLAANEIFVTPGYAPPEQMAGCPEPRSDIFALGATLHHCLTGQHPQKRPEEHIFDFPLIQLFHPQVPEPLNILVSQMLSRDPSGRPASALIVQQQLEHLHQHMARPVVLAKPGVTGNPDAPTVQHESTVSQVFPPFPIWQPAPPPDHRPRVAQTPRQPGQLAASLLPSLGRPWEQARALMRDQNIWTRHRAMLWLTLLVLSIGGSLAFLQKAPDASHIHALGCMLALIGLGILGFHLSRNHLNDPVQQAIPGFLGLALVLTILTLQGLPDMESLLHPLLQNAALSTICAFGLLVIAALSLARPQQSIQWIDHLLLGMLTAGCALWQYGFGQNELAQFPGLTPDLLQGVNGGLIWGLLGLALLIFLFLSKPFGGWSRFGLVVIAGVCTALQYTSSFTEFQLLHLSSTPLIILSFLSTYLPLFLAVLAWITRRPWLTRIALCALALAEAIMLYAQGQQVFFSFLHVTPYPLSITILASPTLYQLLGPILILVALLAWMLLSNSKGGFRWLDHGILLVGALGCARLDDAFWQAQRGLSAPTTDPGVMHQQYLVLAGFIPAYLIYWLLFAFPVVLGAIGVCHLWCQINPYAPIDPWLKRFQAILTLIDRLLSLALISIALLLLSALGLFSILTRVLSSGYGTDHLTLLSVLILLLLPITAILALVLLVRLLRRKAYKPGQSERLALFFSVLTCLLFIWHIPQASTLPLLARHVQLIGNIFHWPSALLYLVLLGELIGSAGLALCWLWRPGFASYRALLSLLFMPVLICALFQLIWPIFLPLSLLFFLPGLTLAAQIEKAA